MAVVTDTDQAVWQQPAVVESFLSGSRRVMPLAVVQFETVVRLLDAFGIVVKRLLDLGAGDGTLAIQVLGRHPFAAVTLVDFSPAMLDAARRRFADLAADVRIVEADMSNDSWVEVVSPGGYDAVVSGYAIHHLSDDGKRAVYRAAYELLRPGGMFINVEHVESPGPELHAAFDRVMVDALVGGEPQPVTPARMAEITDAFHRRQDKDVNRLAPLGDQLAWLRDIGFDQVDCSFKYFELAIFGGRKPLGQ